MLIAISNFQGQLQLNLVDSVVTKKYIWIQWHKFWYLERLLSTILSLVHDPARRTNPSDINYAVTNDVFTNLTFHWLIGISHYTNQPSDTLRK